MQSMDSPELTILMPCLNEAETLATCIRKARGFLSRAGVHGEVLIADNGSTDGSQAIADAEGARLVPISQRGYGAALIGGIAAARGHYVIMGDADDSYDFSRLDGILASLRDGNDLVMGNRFKGGIAPGGRLAVNTNGGGLSCVHPGMYGIFALIEAVRQLRGEAGARQLSQHRTAVVHGNGGTLSSQSTAVLGTAETL